ncbi:hypothetical protein LTS10_012942 [Elasticomyces elasticus]|nr:hypothetical protein LTS10_012942 [Elasticomyces elasticus]
MLLTKLVTTAALALSAVASSIPTLAVSQKHDITEKRELIGDRANMLPGYSWKEYSYTRETFYMTHLNCDDLKHWFDNYDAPLDGLLSGRKRNLQCWSADHWENDVHYDLQFDISMGNSLSQKQALTCVLESILSVNGMPDTWCNPIDGTTICCHENGKVAKLDTIDYDFDTVVEEIQNITERSDPSAHAASVVCAWGWMENGFVREKFFVDGITCNEITNFFLSEQPPALPNDQDRNLQCYAATGTEYNNPGYPLQIDISTHDTPDGKQGMTCEMKQLMKLYGMDLKFCNPITQTCCLY